MIDQEVLLTVILDVAIWLVLYAIVTIALNLQYGYAGIPNMGLVLSVAAGAYVVGALSGRIARLFYGVGLDLDFVADSMKITGMIDERLAVDPLASIALFLVTILLAFVVSAILGFVVSYPSIKVKEIYLMMTLIAAGEALRIIGTTWYPLVGGTFWVSVPNVFAWMGDFQRVGIILVFAVLVFAVFLVVQLMVQSPFGRLIRAVRENETVAESLGKDVVRIKTLVFVVGSMIASLSGVLYAFFSHSVMATAFQRGDWAFLPWLMLMLGGKGNNVGALAGTGVFVVVRRLILIFKYDIQQFIPVEPAWLELLLMSAFLIVLMIYRPEGLIPEKPIKVRGLDYSELVAARAKEE